MLALDDFISKTLTEKAIEAGKDIAYIAGDSAKSNAVGILTEMPTYLSKVWIGKTLDEAIATKFIIVDDLDKLLSSQENGDEGASSLNIDSLEIFENIAFVMAKHADPDNVPNDPDEWLEQFGVFSIYEILPELIALWGMNMETQAESKKNIARLTVK